ncbi:MAG: hypothetical protein NZ739_03520 [Verrucomicrobiae bacterium]|nr:hypothetical protein [Verrucomicrobiae bacterium]MCX7722149.1 hypothetical protein [Verrucomicrobiae bacterium]MDW7979659.1 hypothetical protein [Verrucomicrobiales bacterium]
MDWSKIIRWLKCAAAPALAALLWACAAQPQQTVWAERVGKMTYQDAVAELGPPDRTWPLSEGGFVAEWVTRRAIRSAFATGPSIQPSLGTAPAPGPFGPRERVLRLSFDQDGKLTAGRETVR